MSIVDHLGGGGDPVPQGPHTAAFEQLYLSTAPDIRRFVRSRVEYHEVDDIVAEVFGAAWLAATRQRQVDAAWLMAVARNKVVDQWRRGGRRKQLETALQNHTVVASRIGADDSPRDAEVTHTLAELSPRHRYLLELRYSLGLTVREVARAVGQSERCVESALARGRRAFRAGWAS